MSRQSNRSRLCWRLRRSYRRFISNHLRRAETVRHFGWKIRRIKFQRQVIHASEICLTLRSPRAWCPCWGTPYARMLSVVIEANVEIVVTGMHGDSLFDALEERVSSCATQHETQVKYARLENQQPNILLESHQINTTLATGVKVIMADVITLWALHDIGLPLRGIRAYVPVRTICS